MKTLGLLGGISWVSTIDYYTYINRGVNTALGGNEFAECIIYSVNYGEIIRNNEAHDFEATKAIVLNACIELQKSGAKAILLGANTMHMFADELASELQIPLIHIAKATAEAIRVKGLQKVGLLGTKPTMEMDFFKDKLKDQGIEAIIPGDEDRIFINEKIFTELLSGLLTPETKAGYLSVIDKLIEQGAEGIILGCTEIPLLIKQEDVAVPVFDTTKIHAEAGVRFSLDE